MASSKSTAERAPRGSVAELLRHPGLFSFHDDVNDSESYPMAREGLAAKLGVRPGGVAEWLVEGPGAGGVTSAIQILAEDAGARGYWAVIDPLGECYLPALAGWGLDLGRTMIVRPATARDTCWAIEQCLRSKGVSVTWAWLKERFSERVHRRWQMAAEVGGGFGLFFRPASAQREPVWADLRLLVTPRGNGHGHTRRVNVEVLYRRGGVGGGALVWEIDHAAGHVRLVPTVAHSTTAKRSARA